MILGSGQFTGQRAARPHLVRGSGGVSGEVADLRADIKRDFAANAAIAVEEFTNPAAVAVDSIVVSMASVASVRTLSGDDLDGVIGGAVMDPPRNITVTTEAGGTPAHVPASAVVHGIDINGDAISETLTLSQTAATVVGNKAFKQVTSIVEATGDGTAGAYSYGIGAKMGLGRKIKVRAGIGAALAEISGAAMIAAPTGAIAVPATGLPNGTYDPALDPDGTRDYALYYEYEASENE